LDALVGEVAGLGSRPVWAVDLTGVEAALLLTLLWATNHEVRYMPVKALNRAAAGYRSEGKTDAKDARVLADQARLRRDLQRLRPTEELVVELRLLTSRRADLVADRT
jgi:transposase